MKYLSNAMGSLLGVLALGALAAVLVLVFEGAQRGNEPLSRVSQSPIETPTPPSSPPPERTQVVETPGPDKWSPPTPLPDRGVRVGSPKKVAVSRRDVAIEYLYNSALDGDMLVSSARMQGGVAVVAINLNTGRVQRLSRVAKQGIEEPHISGRYVTWVESVSEPNQIVRQLHVFDLVQTREFTVGQGSHYYYQQDLKDNLLVWQDYRGQGWGIYGYDLTSAQNLTIVEGPGIYSFPRVCSKEWIIYLQNVQEDWPGTANLRAHNLATGEDIPIGQIPFPQDVTAGEQHACDGSRVAWIGIQMEQSAPIYQQHVFDLGTRSDRVLNISIRALPSVLLSGNVLISSVGYDLARDVPFSVFSNVLPEQFHIGSKLLFSQDRAVWIVAESDGSQGIHSAPIIRR